MSQFKVTIPKPNFALINLADPEEPCIAFINEALINFEPKNVFGWHCRILLQFPKEACNKGLPNKDALDRCKQWEEQIEPQLALDPHKPNALKFGNITDSGVRELIYRVFNPHHANDYIQTLIEAENHPFPFEYSIEPDETWEQCDWLIKNYRNGEKVDPSELT